MAVVLNRWIPAVWAPITHSDQYYPHPERGVSILMRLICGGRTYAVRPSRIGDAGRYRGGCVHPLQGLNLVVHTRYRRLKRLEGGKSAAVGTIRWGVSPRSDSTHLKILWGIPEVSESKFLWSSPPTTATTSPIFHPLTPPGSRVGERGIIHPYFSRQWPVDYSGSGTPQRLET